MNSVTINNKVMLSNSQKQALELMNKQMQSFLEMEFDSIWSKINNRDKIKKNFVKKILGMVNGFYFQEMAKRNLNVPLHEYMQFKDMIPYIAYEHYFRTSHLEDSARASLQDDINYQNKIVEEVTAKLIFNEHLQINPLSFTNKYSPEIGNLKMYTRFINHCILEIYPKLKTNDEKITTLLNLFVKSLCTINAIADLLSNGYDSEAYSLWRTCHELECTIILLNNYDNILSKAYVDHLKYLPLDYDDNEENKELSESLKTEMEYYKMNNKKAFINLGWILRIKDYENRNLNFKETLSKLANQSHRYNFYKDASKVIHSSAVHATYNRGAFHADCIYQLYLTFSSIENVVHSFLSNTIKSMDEEGVNRYLDARPKYLSSTREIFEILEKRLNLGIYD